MRGDVAAAAGWTTVNKSEFNSYNDWRTEGLFSARVGWYWTNHLKTSVDVATTSETEIYAPAQPVFTGITTLYPGSRFAFRGHHVAVSQIYQFGHNQWVHPFVAAGVDILAETRSQRDDPLFFYDPLTRQSRSVRDPIEHPDHTDVRARAMVSAGLKAYVSRKTFFLTDVRMTFGRRAEEVQWGFGFGVDY